MQTKSFDNVIQTALKILKPEASFYWTVAVFGIAISILSLAAPISVQTLINTIVNTAIESQVVILSVILFVLLLVSGMIYALQKYVMELFERKFFARIVSDITIQTIYADITYFRNIDRAELINRYFDIMTVQKNVPSILTGGFALVLQAIVGLLITSFYHPAFLILNIAFIFTIYCVWRIWGHKACLSAIDMSEAKYSTAQWLEEIAQANMDFKSHDRIVYALSRSEEETKHYIDERKKHFSFSFKQVLSFLFLYALFSAVLLGLGGLLVIRGELLLGQLVAAELILTAIFFGVSQAGRYLEMIYELVAALDKISYFSKIPIEEDEGDIFIPDDEYDVSFKNVQYAYRDQHINFGLDIQSGSKILACSNSHVLQEFFIDLIEGYRFPYKGQILIGGHDITEINPQAFRDKIYVLDEHYLLNTTIENYLKIAAPNVTKVDIANIFKALHLDETINALPDGLQTRILNTGHPLSRSETLRLKLASALLTEPRILILTELFDVIGYNFRQSIMRYLHSLDDLTLIYFTNRRDLDFFNQYLYFDWEEDIMLSNVEDLRHLMSQET